eukprot:TRINITY_DN35220_c0_g1_i1.p1 TRINITY_DN35220_c0_g1~~TRINITY_DN35220_c0_g1_i1.p1  ORF type:complete len:531 (-),score=107.80 TRINITY_DN35220_c0_g1_i1:190-1782(-)
MNLSNPVEQSARLATKRAFPLDHYGWESKQGQTDLEAAVGSNAAIQDMVSTSCPDVNIDRTFGQLRECGKLMKLALTAARSAPCSGAILAAFTKYQALLKKTSENSLRSVSHCVTGIKHHKRAKTQFQGGRPARALQAIAKCGDLAHEMAKNIEPLIEELARVVKLVETALLQSNDDRSTNEGEKQSTERALRAAKGEQRRLETLIADLEAAERQCHREEVGYARQAAQQRDRESFLQNMGIVMDTVQAAARRPATQFQCCMRRGSRSACRAEEDVMEAEGQERHSNASLAKLQEELKLLQERSDANTVDGREKITSKQKEVHEAQEKIRGIKALLHQRQATAAARAASLEDKEGLAARKRQELHKGLIEQNKSLVETIGRLGGCDDKIHFSEQCAITLQLTVETLGKITTTLKRIKSFWNSMGDRCELLGSCQGIPIVWEMLDEHEQVISGFQTIEERFLDSVMGWASLGIISINAHKTITEAEAIADALMDDLPDGNASVQEVVELAKVLSASLREDSAALESLENLD